MCIFKKQNMFSTISVKIIDTVLIFMLEISLETCGERGSLQQDGENFKSFTDCFGLSGQVNICINLRRQKKVNAMHLRSF